MAWWIWIVVGAVLLIAEVVIAADFWLVFFGLAALAVGLAALGGVVTVAWHQWLVFAATAILLLWLYRTRWKAKLSEQDRPMSGELVGEVAIVTQALPAGGHGQVELHGSSWKATNIGDSDQAPGSRCIVESVNGLTLTVRPE